MQWRVLIAFLLVPFTQAFYPAPIQWSKFSGQNFVLAPRDFKPQQVPNRATAQPVTLAIWEQPAKMSLDEIPHFTWKSDNTVSWAGLCLESNGNQYGDAVRLNHCTRGANQLWSLLPSGSDGSHQFQLKGSNKCMDVATDEAHREHGLNGALVELQECMYRPTGSWRFEEPTALQIPIPPQSDATLSFMRHVMAYISIPALGVLSLSALLWQWQSRSSAAAMRSNREPLSVDQGGVSLVPAVLALSPTELSEPVEVTDARAVVLQSTAELDRGIRASAKDVRIIDENVRSLESSPSARPVDWSNADDVAKLDGRWRLLYSSAFATTRRLGGEWPGPSSSGPVQLGKVLQDIQTRERRLDNVIEPISLLAPWPLPSILTPRANIRLAHTLELYGKSNVRIKTDGGSVQPSGLDLNLPIPQLIPGLAQATFNVSYLDDDVYITRGDRDELRVFVRDNQYEKLLGVDTNLAMW